MHKKVKEKDDKFRQRKLVDIFNRKQRDDAVTLSDNPHANGHSTDVHNITDMEDFRYSGTVRPQPIVRSYGINKEQHPVEKSNIVECAELNDMQIGHKQPIHPLEEVSEETIDRSVDYQGWLESRKRKWRGTREKRKRQRYSQ